MVDPIKDKEYFFIHKNNGLRYGKVKYIEKSNHTTNSHLCETEYDPGFLYVQLDELYELTDEIGLKKIADYGLSEFKRLNGNMSNCDTSSIFAFKLAKLYYPEKLI